MIKRILCLTMLILGLNAPAWGQSVSGVRAFGGGVGVLFGLVGPGNLYLDNQGTMGFMYTFTNFESFSFRNPVTGQAWSGAVMTLGPQLSIGLIQGTNQTGTPVVLIPPPREVGSPLVAPFSISQVNVLSAAVAPVSPVTSTLLPVGTTPVPMAGVQPVGAMRPISLVQPASEFGAPHDIESSLLEIP